MSKEKLLFLNISKQIVIPPGKEEGETPEAAGGAIQIDQRRFAWPFINGWDYYETMVIIICVFVGGGGFDWQSLLKWASALEKMKRELNPKLPLKWDTEPAGL